MQADRHHLGGAIFAFEIELVEGIAQIAEELLALGKAIQRHDLHVIGIQRIRNDQLGFAIAPVVIGQIVSIGVGVIDKPALLDDQACGIGRGPALIPAQGACTCHLGMYFNGPGDMLAFDLFGHILIVDPFIAVAGDLPFGLLHGLDSVRIARHGQGHTIDGNRRLALDENLVQPPEADAGTVFI